MALKEAIEIATSVAGNQAALGERLGLAFQTISNMKYGRRRCTIEQRIQIAEIAGMDPKLLILEGLAERLDEKDRWQAEAKKVLMGIVDAMVNAAIEDAASPSEVPQKAR